MLRKLHSLPSLFMALFLITIATTGAMLSLMPAIHRAHAVVPNKGKVSVAAMAQRVVQHHPNVEKIDRKLSGEVVVYYKTANHQPKADLVNPLTGQSIGPYQPSAFMNWVEDMHRSFLLHDTGRKLAGGVALVMVLICLSGVFLLVRRLGGWKALIKPIKGNGVKRIHSELARFAVLGLLLSSLTGSYMSAMRFGFVKDHTFIPPSFPSSVSGGQPAPVGSLIALKNIDLTSLHELVFPYPGDLQDFYTLTTEQGAGFVDQSTGTLLNFTRLPPMGVFQQWIIRLHTGQGIWWLGLILGASALTVPVLSYTGVLAWWRKRRVKKGDLVNTPSKEANTILLVGTEGQTTWGFARDLQRQLIRAGRHVHCAQMNQLVEDYPQADTLFILTSTYGNGDAPTTAQQFMNKLKCFKSNASLRFAVLGFGDRQFPNFCQFALDVTTALEQKGLTPLCHTELINRSSAEQFREWGKTIADLTGWPLALSYHPQPTVTQTLALVGREDYGVNGHAATSILRFRAAGTHSLPFFEAGDLLGVMPPQETSARFYSLASSTTDDVLEICVRKQPNGVCSSYLHGLQLGDCIEGFIRHNPEFRPAVGRHPVILIGAGAGIGPLTGFIRQNTQRHPMFLYWGGRNQKVDFLYQPDLTRYLDDQRLTGLQTAFSQGEDQTTEKAYVQDKLLQDQTTVRQLLEQGAQILVCGGRGMANGVTQALNDILEPLQTNVDALKAQGRYLEDVY
ncbi:Sulfite reductase [NADPH] flavoprotein alpha-component [Marinomonas spartinae]|uniref:PepSY domain-containing protein n=1 Tax=Marinomonas spartinae TaxID=1792290 RepID=UPI000808A52E|nr:PepSY domain-containing protein [Marinomonas spartinae]SBS39804.1 Sulfite reductase [NADPH] flavoprotein alpha-component [Marinomonas spartinae]